MDRSWDVDECVAGGGGWRVRLLQFEGKLCVCECVCVGGKYERECLMVNI